MLRDYLKIAWRNLVRNKMYSSINIVGLGTGMAVAIVIGLWILDEFSFDHYHDKHSKLAQVWDTQTWNDETGTGQGIDIPLAEELRTRYPGDFSEIALSSPIQEGQLLNAADKQIVGSGLWAQPELPEMLSLKMIKGRIDALKDPSSILLNASLARSLFGGKDPINQIVRMDNKIDVKVAGVFEDLPRNTTLYAASFFLPWDKFVDTQNQEWGRHANWLFVQINDAVDFDKETAKIKDLPKEHLKEGKEEILLHPMDKWHLYSEFKNGINSGGNIQYVWLFGMIGIFVLMLACINFMNLSTARSEKRAKEVGIRKTIGSMRKQLAGQFLCESTLMACMAFVIAILILSLTIPIFDQLANKQMTIPWANPIFWFISLGFTLFTGLISGSYPAFYLSNFQPIKVLKGTLHAGRLASLPRKALVVAQFSVSIILIICTIIVFRQIEFAKNRPVGYTSDGLVSVKTNYPTMSDHYNAIRNDLLGTNVVEDMAESSSPMTHVNLALSGFDWKGKDPDSSPLFAVVVVTHDFGHTIGWEIQAGRDFSRDVPTDSGALIINESALRLMGLKNPVDELVRFNGVNHKVVGVVKDIVMESPYSPVSPTFFILDYDGADNITVRLKNNVSVHDAIAKVETVFRKYDPAVPFDYQFTNQEFARKFSDEVHIGKIASVFAILAISISCLGLFGLASFVAEQRTKEIGVRKILGASIFSVWFLISRDFVALVIISVLIASPTAYYFMNNWLQNFQYHAGIPWWIFIASGMGAIVITMLTVGTQSIRAALTNPVKSLRTD